MAGGTSYGLVRWLAGGSGPQPPLYRSEPGLDPPEVTTIVPAAGTAPGWVFLTPAHPSSQTGPMIIDNAGQPLWFYPVQGAATNFQMQSYRGEPVLTWWEGEVLLPEGIGKGRYRLFDSSYREVTTVRAGRGLVGDLHEFFITPEDTAFFTAYRKERADLSSIGGPRDGVLLNSYLQEVEIATGEVRFEWNAARHVALDESYLSASDADNSGGAYDFFHINSIDVDTDGNLLVSGRHTWTVYKVDRHSGKILWRLNGKLSDFQMDPATTFAFQHHVRHHPGDRLTIFDDGAAENASGASNRALRSRGLEIHLDFAAMRAQLVHEYLPDPSFLASSQGSVQVLPNGNVFVGWGQQPYVSEYASDTRLLYDASLPSGTSSYRAFRYPWAGSPSRPPAIAATRTGADQVSAYVSWNGATEVATWELLAGPSGEGLRTIASAERRRFETTFSARTRHDYLAARALDSAGRVLGRSPVIKL